MNTADPSPVHKKVPHGLCTTCDHYGEDCTGSSASPKKQVSVYAKPTFDFANRLGLSTSVLGWPIFNKRNWRILEQFLKENVESVSGTCFDGMVDGSSAAHRTVEQSIACAGKIFAEKRYHNGIHFYPEKNTLAVFDCCDSVRFVLKKSTQKLFRVSYVDTTVREAFIKASDENEATDILEEQISDGVHHHAIDAYHDDVQAEKMAAMTQRPVCFECGGRYDLSADASAA